MITTNILLGLEKPELNSTPPAHVVKLTTQRTAQIKYNETQIRTITDNSYILYSIFYF